jgi:precorrin-6B methylase 2
MLSSNILNDLQTSIFESSQPDSEMEFEVKFGFFNFYDKFRSQVDFKSYQRLRDKFQSSSSSKTIYHITDYIASDTGLRKQIITTEGGAESTIFQRKNKIQDFDIPDYGMRISLNAEINLSPIENFMHDYVRIKDRESFLYKLYFQIDLTKVSSIQEDGTSKETYEVEIEVLDIKHDTKGKLKTLNLLLKFVFLVLYDTNMVYTMTERRNMSSYINRLLGYPKGSTLKYSMVAKARNLKFHDLVYGGILDNTAREGDYYTVTHKADGIRKFLIINRTGIWLCFPPTECNLVLRFSKENYDPNLDGLVLDGEYIPKGLTYRKALIKSSEKLVGINTFGDGPLSDKELEYIPNAKYWFLVFDVLCVGKNKDVQYLPHNERLSEAYRTIHGVKDVLDNNKLVIHFKSFHALYDRDTFYEVMQRMFREKEILPYADDGLIFMSSLGPYNPMADYRRQEDRYIPLYQRKLSKYSDICKWKPPSQLTIDFAIERKGDGSIVLKNVTPEKTLEPFMGSSFHPFDSLIQVDSENELLEDLPSGAIVEMQWDTEKEFFRPLVVRHDKLYPNSLEVAKDVWSDIHNPITKETLIGKNFTLLRKLHNKVKRKLYETLPGGILLDIGSGRGGDVSKWKKYNQVIAVEPNSEHIQELERRINFYQVDNVHVLQSGGEDTSKIVQKVQEITSDGKVDVITMMLSLTFFWQKQEILNQLVETVTQTLKSGGTFAFMVMNGDVVEEMLQPFFPSILSVDPTSSINPRLLFRVNEEGIPYAYLELQSLISMEEGKGREVKIYIQDSIVGEKEDGSNKIEQQQSFKRNASLFTLPIVKPKISKIKTKKKKEEDIEEEPVRIDEIEIFQEQDEDKEIGKIQYSTLAPDVLVNKTVSLAEFASEEPSLTIPVSHPELPKTIIPQTE